MTQDARADPPFGEFSRIETFLRTLTTSVPGALGLQDDAALLDPPANTQIVVTTDTMVEGVHWIAGLGPDLVARKLLRVNLSDLAAMGARPWVYTLNTAFPPDLPDDWLASFADGLQRDQSEFGIGLVGGDSVSTRGPISVTVTAFGLLPDNHRALRRNAAKVGDGVYVTGTIGDGFLGLQVGAGKLDACPDDVRMALSQRLDLPTPRLDMGLALSASLSAGACLDISDGLVGDAGHIARASGVGIDLDLASVPLSTAAVQGLRTGLFSLPDLINGGDDYELLFTASDETEVMAISQSASTPVTRIGQVRNGSGVRVLTGEGAQIAVGGSWNHFKT